MSFLCRFLFAGLLIWQCAIARAIDPPKTGPETEKRFPPLRVPAGFKATLFACDPLIEYPSAISAGPRPGAVFVAVDYMTGLGTEITRRSEVRLVEDTNDDGYADKATVFADGLNSIMGLVWHDNTLYVMHAPFLTALRDTKGAGKADERTDIVTGLGLTPEDNPVRLHCANGVTIGHDGWLYLALGDHGCNVQRPEGDRLVLEGGGILRCRPDGRDLHVFSSGLRNIYDVALDAELNVFVRDNENDGGDYKIRVCHSFFGADHGYPYLYYEQPAEALRPIADLGLGSSAGGVCYLEQQFPAEYRGNLFFCEWGKSLVRYPLTREGSSFASPKENEFATSGDGDPYGFKPTDVIVQRDGTLMVSDYADGQRPMRGRGRIYHIAYADSTTTQEPAKADVLARLDSESYFERCEAQATIQREGDRGLATLREALRAGRLGQRGRMHAIWAMAQPPHELKAIQPLLALAKSDPAPAIRAQAIRALADLFDPILMKHRLAAKPDGAEPALTLIALAKGQDRQVQVEVVLALSRLRWSGAPDWLKQNLDKPDAALAHAEMQALRKANNWPSVLKWLDAPSDDPLRSIALLAVSRQYDADLADGLIARLAQEKDSKRALEYATDLSHVYKRPGPWVYWDYRPKPRPVNTVSWERTEAIAAALNRALTGGDASARVAILQLMQREKVPASTDALESVVRNSSLDFTDRLSALRLLAQTLDRDRADPLLSLAEKLEDGPVLAEALRLVSTHPQLNAAQLLARKLDSTKPEVRAAAAQALGELRSKEGREELLRLLTDGDATVRRAAAVAAGKLEEKRASEPLIKLTADPSAQVRNASLDALRRLDEPRCVPLAVAALGDRETELVALHALRDLGGPEQTGAITDLAKRNPSLNVLTSSMQALTAWRDRQAASEAQRAELDRAAADIQGDSGNLIAWQISGPMKIDENSYRQTFKSRRQFASGIEGRLVLAAKGTSAGNWFWARTDIAVPDATDIELLGSSNGALQVWLNDKSIYQRDKQQSFRIDSDRFSARLAKGNNRLVVIVDAATGEAPVEFHLRFRRKSAQAEHESLLQGVLAKSGNVDRGREVFMNIEKSLCLKCHRVGDQGERTGPELTGLGGRFSRIYIAESILQPSRTIAPSFGTLVVALVDGRTESGVKVAETETTLTLVDNQGKKQLLAKAEIEEQAASPLSTMPEGLEKRITPEEFVDLTAFLASLKQTSGQ